MAKKHFFEQIEFAKTYLHPYFETEIGDISKSKILEIGCAEGGLLDYFSKLNIAATGIELVSERVELGLSINPKLDMKVGDITDDNFIDQFRKNYDIIIIRDVIEHVVDRNSLFKNLEKLLASDGFIFVAFPPRFSAFAGHQQNARSLLKITPYLHLLPNFVIRLFGKILNEDKQLIESIIINYNDGLSIRKFEKLLLNYQFKPVVKDLFIIRPVFKIRYNLNPVKMMNIPILREFVALGCEYLIKKS